MLQSTDRHRASVPDISADPTERIPRRRGERVASADLVVRNGMHSVRGRRETNEDFALLDLERNIWVVSDGIGGAPFGEVMSRVACNATPPAWDATDATQDIPTRLREVTARVDRTTSAVSVLLGDEGSGATYLLASFDGRHTLTVAAVGDTQAYLLRGGKLTCVGGGSAETTHSNMLDSALGYQSDPTPIVVAQSLLPADVILLCSDGVWSTQDVSQLTSALLMGDVQPTDATALNPQVMAESVVAGSDMSDNATAIVLVFGKNYPCAAPELLADPDPDSTAEFPAIITSLSPDAARALYAHKR